MTGQPFLNRERCDDELTRLLCKHTVISFCSAAIVFFALNPSSASLLQTIFFFALPLGLFTDMVRLKLKMGRMHSLITKCCLYAVVFLISPDAALSAIVTYVLIECAVTSFQRLSAAPDSLRKPYEDIADGGR
ncbi:transporter [Bacillus sp. YAF8]|uniref:transporter n=1 Tax=Bacillus TaxID=1386 RepID=UPI0034578EE0